MDYIGIRPFEDGPVLPAPVRDAQASSAFSDLADQLPHCERLNAYFNNITVPAGFSVASGESAWFVFGQWRVGAGSDTDIGECAIVGAFFDLLPTDSTGLGGPGISWGSAKGQSAAVVIGVSLGIPFQSWTARPAYLPAIETVAPSLLSPRGARPYLFRQRFPSGTYADATPQRLRVLDRTNPFVHRAVAGATIDAALVVNGSQIAAGAGTLVGEATVDVLVVPTHGAPKFTT
jgi:hypothetical protein